MIADTILSDIGTSNFYKITDPSFDCSTGYYGEIARCVSQDIIIQV